MEFFGGVGDRAIFCYADKLPFHDVCERDIQSRCIGWYAEEMFTEVFWFIVRADICVWQMSEDIAVRDDAYKAFVFVGDEDVSETFFLEQDNCFFECVF